MRRERLPRATHNWGSRPEMASSVDQAAAAAAAQGMYIDKAQYEAMEQKLYKAVECLSLIHISEPTRPY